MGRDSFLVKADIKEAYCMVPVHPGDQYLFGVRWNDTVFVVGLSDTAIFSITIDT